MIAFTCSWIIHVSESKKNIYSILAEQKQSRLLIAMRDAARRKAIYLHRMAMMEDEPGRNHEYIKFKQADDGFIAARDELLSLERVTTEIISIWEKAKPYVDGGRAVQQAVLTLLLEGNILKANRLLLEKVIPLQNHVNNILSAMFTVQDHIAEAEHNEVYIRNQKIYWIALSAGSGAVILTFIIAFIVIRRATDAEAGLREARRVAQMATDLKSQFLANMSHEIRTPLTAVIGYADTLLEQNLPEEERQHSVTRILHNGQHLLRIINDILDISKIEAGQLALEKIVVSPLVLMRDIDSLIGESIRKKGLEFNINYQFPIPSKISTDPTRLMQVLLNLIGNAKKFTAQGSIDVDVRFLAASNQMCYVIQDSGVGMSTEEQARLFKPFSQADASTTREFGGTGLGLCISHQLAKMLGGDLVCDSQKGQGSCFVVTIAAGVADISEQHEAPMIETLEVLEEANDDHFVVPSLEGKVLLAEDLPDNQRLISMYIMSTGASVVVVDNGQRAVEQALANEFDLILMDIQMPIMGGGEAVQWLRRVGNQSPIAMLSANAMKEEQEQCLEFGANVFLTKPIDKKSFFIMLTKYLCKNSRSGEEVAPGIPNDDMAVLVAQFVASLPGSMHELQQALKMKNWAQVKSIVHQLKGLGGGFGFPKITEQCVDVETKVREENHAAAVIMLSELFNYVGEIVDAHTDNATKKRQLGA